MKKEEILAKSREENKDKDMYSEEVAKIAGRVSSLVASAVTLFVYLFELFTTGKSNLAIYSIVFSIFATTSIIRYIKLKEKKDLICSIIYSVNFVALIIGHIYIRLA